MSSGAGAQPQPYMQNMTGAGQTYQFNLSPSTTAGATMPTVRAPQPTTGYTPQPGRTAPSGSTMPITPTTEPPAVTLESLQYFNGYLKTQIGKKVTVDFLIGTSSYVDRTGTLLGVGANYIVLNEQETDDILICDFYSIKFVTIYR